MAYDQNNDKVRVLFKEPRKPPKLEEYNPYEGYEFRDSPSFTDDIPWVPKLRWYFPPRYERPREDPGDLDYETWMDIKKLVRETHKPPPSTCDARRRMLLKRMMLRKKIFRPNPFEEANEKYLASLNNDALPTTTSFSSSYTAFSSYARKSAVQDGGFKKVYAPGCEARHKEIRRLLIEAEAKKVSLIDSECENSVTPASDEPKGPDSTSFDDCEPLSLTKYDN